MSKKGELTTQQIVTIIILIVSFAVILFFIIRINFIEISDKEICRNSVIMRDKTKISDAPLNCKINYLCITSSGKCEKMTNPNLKEVKDKEEIYNILANEIIDCWWMFGEGKVNYAGKEMITGIDCAICSQIVFDESLKEEIFTDGKIDKREFYNYLANTKISGKEQTYLEYYLGTKDVSKIYDGYFGYLDIEKIYWIMTGVKSEVNFLKWSGTIGAVVGIISFSNPWTASAILTVKGVLHIVNTAGLGGIIGGYLGTIVEGESGDNYIFPTLIESNSKEYEDLNCSEIRSIS